jgi:hypothetical protein
MSVCTQCVLSGDVQGPRGEVLVQECQTKRAMP